MIRAYGHCKAAHGFAGQRGASLLEGIAYLGIAALVILGAVSLLTMAFGSAQANRASEEVVALRTAAKRLYGGQRYPVNMTEDMIAAKAIPSTLVVDAASKIVRHAWGGDVEVYGNISGVTQNDFQVIYRDVPQDACVAMLAGASGWAAVGTDSANNITALPLTTEGAANACKNPINVLWFIGA